MQLLNFATLIKIEDTWMYAFIDYFLFYNANVCILLLLRYFSNVYKTKAHT